VYNIKRRLAKFDTEISTELEAYEDILNNPLCTITECHRERLVEKRFDDGKLTGMDERIVLVVEWDEKYIA